MLILKGLSQHMVISPPQHEIGGSIVRSELYSKAPGIQFKLPRSLMDFMYARPKTHKTPAKNLDVIMRFFDDELNGTSSLESILI